MDRFTWDEAKSEENRRQRGFGFELVYEFNWDAAVFQDDLRFAYGERRIRAFGRIEGKPYNSSAHAREGSREL
jgi:uncharacterized DUF497 family protein